MHPLAYRIARMSIVFALTFLMLISVAKCGDGPDPGRLPFPWP